MSDSEDEEVYEGEEIELGFVVPQEDETDAQPLLLHESADWADWDGGKVGGKPSWLDRAGVPSAEALTCAACTKPMSFLLQIYCPLDDPSDAFHRSLYVFCCRTTGCENTGHAKCFRSQLPRENRFYPSASGEALVAVDAASSPSLCALCGQRATLTCSACHVAQYCCKEHQKDHWKAGHKQDCAECLSSLRLVESLEAQLNLRKGSKWVFPEYELEIDHEPDSTKAVNEYEAKLLADFEARKAQGANAAATGEESDVFTDDSEIDVSQQELNDALGSTADQDKHYIRFLTRVALAKDQVLRYGRWQDPSSVLWVHSSMVLADDTAIPPCPRCGAARKFEFQVLPQLLSYLHVDQASSLQQIGEKSCEWGTLVVYTCTSSCKLEGEYAEEHVHYQNPYVGA